MLPCSALHPLLHPPAAATAFSPLHSSQSAQLPLPQSAPPPARPSLHASQPAGTTSAPAPPSQHGHPVASQGKDGQAWLASEFRLLRQAFFTEPDDQSAWLYLPWLLRNVLPTHPPRLLSCTVTGSPSTPPVCTSASSQSVPRHVAGKEEPPSAAAAGQPFGLAVVLLFSEPVSGVCHESVGFHSPCFTALDWQAGGQRVGLHSSRTSRRCGLAGKREGVEAPGSSVWYARLQGSCSCKCQGHASPPLATAPRQQQQQQQQQQHGAAQDPPLVSTALLSTAGRAGGCPRAALSFRRPWCVVAVGSGRRMAEPEAGDEGEVEAGAGAGGEADDAMVPGSEQTGGVAGLVEPNSAAASALQTSGQGSGHLLPNSGSSSSSSSRGGSGGGSRGEGRVEAQGAVTDAWRLQLLEDEIGACRELMELEGDR